ncbi:MAG: efflux RND transporter permease subunit [Cyanobacteriota/Melainabacteria group bacterium]
MTRPVTIIVATLAIILASFLAISRMKVDIFPDLNLPVIYVVQPYGGMDPAQMEGFMVSHYEDHFLYISGVEHIESKSIQGVSVMKILFHPGTDMADAMAQVIGQVERSRSYMPPGTVTPFILRFDAGNVPVGYVVLSSKTLSIGEVADLAYERVRPVISTLPGASTPPPFGGNVRSIVISVDPERLKSYNISSEDVVEALAKGNVIIPSGVVRTGQLQRVCDINSVVKDIKELEKLPVKPGAGAEVYLGDLGTVSDTTDIPTGYALVNKKRSVFMAVSKLSSASTVTVVEEVKKAIPYIRDLLPKDVKVSFEFDQSIYVTEAVKGVLFEGGIGAVLTGLMVLLFLGDARSAIIVVLTIPAALLSAIVFLWMAGQSINIMTLGGLALSIGVLVDEATVAIENIHTHLGRGVEKFQGIYQACCEVVTPQLLAMLSVVSVFTPAFLMSGSTQALFVPLSLAVGFAMISSYILSNTLVPVLSGWILKEHDPSAQGNGGGGLFGKVRRGYARSLISLMRIKWVVIGGYGLVAVLLLSTLTLFLGTEIFPTGNPSGFQLRLKAPAGTRIEQTEHKTQQALDIIAREAGVENIDVSIAYVGTNPPTFGISNVVMWTSGPQEAVILVSFKHDAHMVMADLKEKLRKTLHEKMPETDFSFEAGDIVNKIMNFGAPTPLKIDIAGPNFAEDKHYAERVMRELRKIADLRDLQIVQPLEYPTIDVDVNRKRAGQLGVTVKDIGRALVPATYSSRFVQPIFWISAKSGVSYQVQLEVPTGKMDSVESVESIPVMATGNRGPFVRDVAQVKYGTMTGEFDRYNMRRMVSITANIAGSDLGRRAREVTEAIARAGERPRGVTIDVRGQVPTMHDTFFGLGAGLILAVVTILLMLISYFQLVRLSLAVISVVPAILCGVVLTLQATGTTLNVQSFMGAIMSIGVGVANAILIIAFAESRRMSGLSPEVAGVKGAVSRLRPVLMTSIAMIAGMIPMALGLGEGGDRTAPLGRAVIGGLAWSTIAVLFVLPLIFSVAQKGAKRKSQSMLEEVDQIAIDESKEEVTAKVKSSVS